MKSKRKIYIDTAKGLGIILMMMSHSCGFPIIGGIANAYYMPMFFIISGYNFHKGKSLKNDIEKREKRLIGAYFTYSIIGMMIFMIMSIFNKTFSIYSNILRNIISMLYSRAWLFRGDVANNIYFSVGGQFPLWFFTSMAIAMVIFIVAVYALPKNKASYMMAMLGMVLATGLLSYLPILLPWSVDMAFLSAFFIMVGYILGQADFFEKLTKYKFIVVIVIAAIIYAICYYFNPNTAYSVGILGDHNGFLDAFNFAGQGIFGSIVVITICKLFEHNIIGKMFAVVGRHSIIIFGLHLFGFTFIDNIYGKFGISPTVHGVIRASDLFKIAVVAALLVA
ncbi:MAG: acyltransferase family protein, partial [Oscillospiraceae bacterium]